MYFLTHCLARTLLITPVRISLSISMIHAMQEFRLEGTLVTGTILMSQLLKSSLSKAKPWNKHCGELSSAGLVAGLKVLFQYKQFYEFMILISVSQTSSISTLFNINCFFQELSKQINLFGCWPRSFGMGNHIVQIPLLKWPNFFV